MKRKAWLFWHCYIKGYGVPSSKDVVKRPRKRNPRLTILMLALIMWPMSYTSNTLRLLKLTKKVMKGIRFPCDYDQCNSSYTQRLKIYDDIKKCTPWCSLSMWYSIEYNATMKGSHDLKQLCMKRSTIPMWQMWIRFLTPYKHQNIRKINQIIRKLRSKNKPWCLKTPQDVTTRVGHYKVLFLLINKYLLRTAFVA